MQIMLEILNSELQKLDMLMTHCLKITVPIFFLDEFSYCLFLKRTQLAFTFSKLTIEALQQGVKCVQS